ncbi:CDP-glucose 4,6-dehydratase [Bosea sp. BH3]|uniref:CDP-glucose 4,6-dehydratase n=1 Tax=Bosea sp. BH3 TaxID=2871701 RepID=UPI0021CB137B|nr:CDP-glucose 4,6-dehydratase [Bosea sp. BH3]MCU4181258.1 CDP-glucose 4,6-dehydratase [Bosea sp. BH3]
MSASPVPLLPFETTLAGRRLMVTGHTGFTGGWLSLWLKSIGAEVSGLALEPNTSPNLFSEAAIGDGILSEIGDIRHMAAVQRAVEAATPEVIFHLAAQPLVSRAFEDPIESFATNVLGTAHVLEAARNTPGVKAVVCITTDKVYADQSWHWGYREPDPLGGKDPYSASKACTELVAASYRATLAARGNGVRIATARGGNIIGGGDWSDNRIVPDFVRATVSGSGLTIRNPQAIRPWQHVLALVHGYMVLAHNLLSVPETDASWNFGPRSDEMKPVSALLDALQGEWTPIKVNVTPGSFPETHFLHLDSTKARRVLGWQPPIDFAGTVALTVDWYRRHAEDPGSARATTLEQISGYRSALLAQA